MAGAHGMTEQVYAVENRDGASDMLFVCEHASNHFPESFGTLGLSAAAREAHIAWDPGALGLARGLAQRLDAALVHAKVSRLIYDLNRPPNAPGAMPAKSELFDIPGNASLSADDRAHRTAQVYVPFHDGLHKEIARRIAIGRPTVLVTIHSFTPVYFGKKRDVEFGIIHDADTSLAQAVLTTALLKTKLVARMNEPYSAADQVTHTLRLHATPYGLPNVMLEVRNDLIATRQAQVAMSETLAPVLNMGLVEIQRQAKAS